MVDLILWHERLLGDNTGRLLGLERASSLFVPAGSLLEDSRILAFSNNTALLAICIIEHLEFRCETPSLTSGAHCYSDLGG